MENTCPTCGGPTCPHCGKSPHSHPQFRPYFRPWYPGDFEPYVGDVIPNPYVVTCGTWATTTTGAMRSE